MDCHPVQRKRDSAVKSSTQDIHANAAEDNCAKEKQYVWVTRAKRKAMQREEAQLVREERAKKQKVKQEAQAHLLETISQNDEHFEPDSIAWDDIPFEVHATHRKLVYLGGYVGCLQCGSHASAKRRNNRLIQICRNACPAGTRGVVLRMQKGGHPKGNAGQQWPDGSKDPKPRVVIRRIDAEGHDLHR